MITVSFIQNNENLRRRLQLREQVKFYELLDHLDDVKKLIEAISRNFNKDDNPIFENSIIK
ncbi:hypothetical protein D8V62_23870, partial [Salmonella enterica]|nr:hypothetical protein [Salmonella enterica]